MGAQIQKMIILSLLRNERERVIAGKTTEQLKQQVREFKKENQAL
jgi:hypothetical protein